MNYWIDVTDALDYETIKGYDVRSSANCEMCCHTVHKLCFTCTSSMYIPSCVHDNCITCIVCVCGCIW